MRQQLEEMTGYTANEGSGPSIMGYSQRDGPLREENPWLWNMSCPTLFPEGDGGPSGPLLRDAWHVGVISHLMEFVDQLDGAAPSYFCEPMKFWLLGAGHAVELGGLGAVPCLSAEKTGPYQSPHSET